MTASPVESVLSLRDAAGARVEVVGGKAANLARLAAAGFPVPPGLVVTTAALALPASQLETALHQAVDRVFSDGRTNSFAVRSSAASEDQQAASFAGQYETFLDVPRQHLLAAVQRCAAAAASERVAAYHRGRGPDRPGGTPTAGMAVLVQQMVPAQSAGVAFTANPLTGARDETHITAVRGLGERLVGGGAEGDEWVVRGADIDCRRNLEDAIDRNQARAIAELAREVESHSGEPQDIEWAIAPSAQGSADRATLVLLQSRPMTALPAAAQWTPPGPGLWMRNLRLGEWLPEPMTPLFDTWLLPVLEDGYLEGMRASIGAALPFRYATVNGWYYIATPRPTPTLLVRALARGRRRIVRVLYNTLIRVFWDPVASDRAVLADLYEQWHAQALPTYRRTVAGAETNLHEADAQQLMHIVERVGNAAGRQLWFLAIIGGSAWKMESCLSRFVHRHLDGLTRPGQPLAEGVQVLLRGLNPDPSALAAPAHAVISVDWYWPIAGQSDSAAIEDGAVAERHVRLASERMAAADACHRALEHAPGRLRRFQELVQVTQRYARIREEQARELTLGWPLLRRCAHRLGADLAESGLISDIDDVFFLTRDEVTATGPHQDTVTRRRARWEAQRRLSAPLTLGRPPRLIGDPIERAVQGARGRRPIPEDAIVGQPASAGRATGPVHRIDGPEDFADFKPGEVLLAKSTAPAWTPLFSRAAAVITDGGAAAAHASLVAREYGIPAVVGTGDATRRLRNGDMVTVDGSAGFVALYLSTGPLPR